MSISAPETAQRGRFGAGLVSPFVGSGHRAVPAVIIASASSLIGTAVVTSGLGVVFWWLAARYFPPASLGLAAAAVSGTTLLGAASVLGLGTLLIGELARHREQQGSLLTTGLFVSGACGLVVGALFGGIGPILFADLRPLEGDPWTIGIFAVAVSATALGLVLDQCLVGLLRSELQFARNVTFALAKLAALFVAGLVAVNRDALTIFGTWPAGNVISLLALAALLLLRPQGIRLGAPQWSLLRRLGGAALSHHTLNLALQAPSLILPIAVTVLLSATTNAYFYTGWMIASVAFVPQSALAVTLYAVAAREPANLSLRSRQTLGLGVAAALGAIVVVLVGAERLLGVFGSGYAAEASFSLRILILGAFPLAIKTHYVALSRLHNRVGVAAVVIWVGAGLELLLAGVGAHIGELPTFSIAWVAALCLEAAWMAPTVWRAVTHPDGARRQRGSAQSEPVLQAPPEARPQVQPEPVAEGSMVESPSVSVVICAYTEERWGDIQAAIASVRAQTLPSREIILVIDHNPALLERSRAEFPGVLVLENASVRGVSGARNTGIAAAHGDFIAFLDDDGAAAPNWLAELTNACNDPLVLGAGGWVDPNWVNSQPRWFPDEFLWVVGCSYRGLPRHRARVRNLYGGCCCLRHDVFRGVGGFRTQIGRLGTIPLGCEETDLAIRAGQRWPEHRFVHEPRASILHNVPEARGRWAYFTARCYAEGRSKAWLARRLGTHDGLAAERSYVSRTLPAGVLRGLRDGVLGRDTAGFARAGAIVLGLGYTAVGYAVGVLIEYRAALKERFARAGGSAVEEKAA